jgi:hypothetical protein
VWLRTPPLRLEKQLYAPGEIRHLRAERLELRAPATAPSSPDEKARDRHRHITEDGEAVDGQQQAEEPALAAERK